MARREKPKKKTKSRVARVKSAVGRRTKKVAARLRSRKRSAVQKTKPVVAKKRVRGDGKAARPVRREADIPMDVVNRTYSPKQTSIKAAFRTSGADHQRDQEFAGGYVDDQWAAEDRFTNKSGDPRIGTHGRKYEPGE